jgi:hypothetical protein
MNLSALLSKVKEGLTTAGHKFSDVASNVTAKVSDVASGVATSVANVADDTKDFVLDLANLRSVRERIKDSLLDACRDGSITTEELALVKEMQTALEISDDEMKSIRLEVLQEILQRSLKDNVVSAEEASLLTMLKADLSEADLAPLKADLDKVTALAPTA